MKETTCSHGGRGSLPTSSHPQMPPAVSIVPPVNPTKRIYFLFEIEDMALCLPLDTANYVRVSLLSSILSIQQEHLLHNFLVTFKVCFSIFWTPNNIHYETINNIDNQQMHHNWDFSFIFLFKSDNFFSSF